jgi:beta-xylosidase
MIHDGGDYWLLYSGNWWSSADYAIGYARCDAPDGPCVKPRQGPLVATGPAGLGPGGAETFVDGTGQRWMAYHAWAGTVGYAQGGRRTLRIGQLSFGDHPILGPTP